jgi:hypothetical protein
MTERLMNNKVESIEGSCGGLIRYALYSTWLEGLRENYGNLDENRPFPE